MIIGVINKNEEKGSEIIFKITSISYIDIIIDNQASSIALSDLGKSIGLLLDKQRMNFFIKAVKKGNDGR